MSLILCSIPRVPTVLIMNANVYEALRPPKKEYIKLPIKTAIKSDAAQ